MQFLFTNELLLLLKLSNRMSGHKFSNCGSDSGNQGFLLLECNVIIGILIWILMGKQENQLLEGNTFTFPWFESTLMIANCKWQFYSRLMKE